MSRMLVARLVKNALANGRLEPKQLNQIVRLYHGRALIGNREVVG